MRRASPPIPIPDLDIIGVTAVNTDPSEADAISLSTSDVRYSGGMAQPINAVMPDKHHYQKLRFMVDEYDHSGNGGADGITGTPTDVEITIWIRTAGGHMLSAGTAVWQADGSFTEVEIDNYDARYYATVTTLAGGTTPAVNARVWVQGVHSPTYVATQ